jgi:hypothetical protein
MGKENKETALYSVVLLKQKTDLNQFLLVVRKEEFERPNRRS